MVSCISTLVLWSPRAPSSLEEHTPSRIAENRLSSRGCQRFRNRVMIHGLTLLLLIIHISHDDDDGGDDDDDIYLLQLGFYAVVVVCRLVQK